MLPVPILHIISGYKVTPSSTVLSSQDTKLDNEVQPVTAKLSVYFHCIYEMVFINL
jgi:hypothetical protein